MGQTVGIREFKARLSEYMKRVRRGQIILITDRGQPIGRVIPVQETGDLTLRALQEAGYLSWSGRRLKSLKPVARIKGKKTVSDLLLEGRD